MMDQLKLQQGTKAHIDKSHWESSELIGALDISMAVKISEFRRFSRRKTLHLNLIKSSAGFGDMTVDCIQ